MSGCAAGPLTEADAAGLTNMIDDDGDQETISDAAGNSTCAIPLPPPEEENWEPETELNLQERGQCTTGWSSNPYWYDNDTASIQTQPMVPPSNNTSFTVWESPKHQDYPRASAAWESSPTMDNLTPPTRPKNSEGEEESQEQISTSTPPSSSSDPLLTTVADVAPAMNYIDDSSSNEVLWSSVMVL